DAAYFFDPTPGTWKPLATFRRNDAQHSFSYVASFVEDFGGTLGSRRSCMFGNAWLRTFQSGWIDLRTASYATGGSKTNKDADVLGGMFRLETGGNTTNDTPVYTRLSRQSAPVHPTDQSPRLSLTSSGQSVMVQWQTLPWRKYYLTSTTDLLRWPTGQPLATVSNRWVEAVGSGVKFFRTISLE
ncbi:DUF3472 domain-containing protein, partial [bacterium]|nr:DUF3472 domain-containing protein [bacterium]